MTVYKEKRKTTIVVEQEELDGWVDMFYEIADKNLTKSDAMVTFAKDFAEALQNPWEPLPDFKGVSIKGQHPKND